MPSKTITARIRPARRADLKGITRIYNDAVLKSTATFDLTPKTAKEQSQWFDEHGPRLPILAAEENGVIGWASLSAWSGRCAYADTAELSVYVDEPARGRGIGLALTTSILAAGRKAGLHTVISRIAGESRVMSNLEV